MNWKYYIPKWHILAFFYFALILVSFIVPANASTTIGFQERYYDSVGVAHDFNNKNLAEYPIYTKLETPDNYWISRIGDTIYLPKKSWIEYQFYPERIVPRYRIDNYSQINSLVTKVNASVWYLTVPFSAYRYKSITDDLIDMGAFKRTTKVTVTDSNTTLCEPADNNTCPDFRIVPKVVNNDIRLYFNPQNFMNVVYPLYLTENTITMDNATFWASQDCGNGFWSAYGGGSCATPLNDSIYVNTTAYYDMESTNGTIEHGINKYGRFPNSSINATFFGNGTLTYNSSRDWGNALLLDGTNDYLLIPSTAGLATHGGVHGFVRTHVLNKTGYIWVDYQDSVNENRFYINNDKLFFVGFDNGAYQYILNGTTDTNWSKVYGAFGVNYAELFRNGVSLMNDSSVNMGVYTHNVYVGEYPLVANSYFDGEIDEIILTTYPYSVAVMDNPYATSWNKSFLNNTVSGYVSAVKFNIYNLNVQGNTANISARQNGTGAWTQIATNYSGDNTTWINGTWWQNTDFAVNVSGNGSSRAFIVSMTYDKITPPAFEITGYVNNTLGAFVDGALVTINGASTLSRHTYLVNNTDLCNFNHTSNQCDGTRQSGTTYNATSNIQLIVLAHANNVSQTADITVNIDGVNVTRSSGRPLGAPPEESYKETTNLVPIYSNYTVYFANYHHYEWREYPLVHGYYNLTSANGTQMVLAQQIGYANFTGTLNVNANMTYNITLQEKETVSEGTVIDYSLVGAMIGGLLAFVLLRKKRKDDDYKYKRE